MFVVDLPFLYGVSMPYNGLISFLPSTLETLDFTGLNLETMQVIVW